MVPVQFYTQLKGYKPVDLPGVLLLELYFWSFLTLWSASLVIFSCIARMVKVIGFTNRLRWPLLFFVLPLGISVWSILIALPRYQLLPGLWNHAPQHGLAVYDNYLESAYAPDIQICQTVFFLVMACLLLSWLLEIPAWRSIFRVYKRADIVAQIGEVQQFPLFKQLHRQRWLGIMTILCGLGFLAVGILMANTLFVPTIYGFFLPFSYGQGSVVDPNVIDELIVLETASLLIVTIGGPLLFLVSGLRSYLEARRALRYEIGARRRQDEQGSSLWRNLAAGLLLVAGLAVLIFTATAPTLISNVMSDQWGAIDDFFDIVVFSVTTGIGGLLWLVSALLLFERPNQNRARVM